MDTNEKIQKYTKEINKILSEDDGSLEFVSFDDESGFAYFKLLGIFEDNPMAMIIFRGGVERYLLARIPELKRIEKIS